jgi:hypothetical protein
MSDWLNAPRSDYKRVTIPTIWVALALSLLIHLAVLWVWLPRVHLLSADHPERDNPGGALAVRLAPRPSEATAIPPAPSSSPALQPRPSPTHRTPPVKVAPRPSSSPPVIAMAPAPPTVASPPPTAASPPPISVPAATIALPPATPPVAAPATAIALPPATPPIAAPAPAIAASPRPSDAAPPPPAVEGDLSSYIEARRRARGQVTAPLPQESPPQSGSSRAPRVEDEIERSNRIIAANLGLDRTPTVGYDPRGGGGIFELQRVGYDAAEFIFFGWNKDIRRNSRQLIEVVKGDNSDIRIAVVRRRIATIRAEEPGDFLWVSQRLGRRVMLSARPSDNAELEDFMMQEFFPDPRLRN